MNKDLKILLVEDETLIAIGLSLQLETAGYSICDQIATGEKAVQAAEEVNPDLIIMDINLAGKLDGLEAARIIQSSRAVPIIFITGYMDKELDRRALEINPLALLRKPLHFAELETLLDNQLKLVKEQ